MDLNDVFSNIDTEHLIKVRRDIHQWPELGFELPKTLDLVRSELARIGIPYTEEFGTSSITAVINKEKTDFTIALRADMDALPLTEINDVPYKSKIDGQMHACGHDSHTAMLLSTAEALNTIKDQINCSVVFLFQASEEGPESGARLMVQSGVLKNVDIIAAMHVDNNTPTGRIAARSGISHANNRTFEVEILGRTAHAAKPESGVDAISIMVKIYTAIYIMLSREVSPMDFRVLNIGKIEGGTAVNNCPGHAKIGGTLRTFDRAVDAFIGKRIEEISQSIASDAGATAQINIIKNQPPLITNGKVTDAIIVSAGKIVGKGNAYLSETPSLGSEDFSLFAAEKPAAYIKLGTGCEEKGTTTPFHKNDFTIDEEALVFGVKTFVQFVVDNMDGITL